MNLFSCLIFAFLLFMILLVILRLLERCFWWRRDQHPRHVPISSKGRETGQLPEWLNDEDINGYLDLIVQRSQRNPNLPKVYSFSTFFYQKLVHSGFAGVSRWTKKVNIFEYDLLLVPIHHMGNHWCMVLIDFEQRQMVYYDSMLQDNEACLAKLRDYLVEEAKDKKGRKLAFDNWTFECRKGIPYQTNNCDCGVFACMFAEYVSRRAPITFSQTHIPYFRDRMAYELSNQKLL